MTLEKGYMQSTHILVEGNFLYSRGIDILVVLELFKVWEDGGNWVHKIFSWKYLRASFASIPRVQSASTRSLLWISFRVYCSSATAVTNDLILIELDRGQYSLFYNSLPFGLNVDQVLGGVSWPVCPMALGILIPRSGEDFIDRPLDVLLLD